MLVYVYICWPLICANESFGIFRAMKIIVHDRRLTTRNPVMKLPVVSLTSPTSGGATKADNAEKHIIHPHASATPIRDIPGN